MQFDVIRWQTSPSVMKMRLEEKGAYFGLICSEWIHGPLPNEPEVLWQYAGAKSPEDFERVKDVVLAKFKVSQDGLFLSNDTVAEKREEAVQASVRKSELRSKAGKKGAAAKWQKWQKWQKDGNTHTTHTTQDTQKPSAGANAPSGGKAPKEAKPPNPSDPRRKGVLALFDEHLKRTIPDEAARPQFHPEVTGPVDALLKKRPKASPEIIKTWLQNRETSDKVNYAESPRKWIPRLADYAQGPLTEYNKPKNTPKRPLSMINGSGFPGDQRRKRELATADRAAGGSL